jgi:hypothetical protein
MEFTALFLAVTIVMIVAWRGPRSLALTLFARPCSLRRRSRAISAAKMHAAVDGHWVE